LPRPYRTEWTGELNITTERLYEFFVRTDDPLTLEIDGETLLATGDDLSDHQVVFPLGPGRHAIKVVYNDKDGRSEVSLKWRPLGSDQPPVAIPAQIVSPWAEPSPSSCSPSS